MGKYTRKTNRGIHADRIASAVNKVLTENKKIREVARHYEIPEATLRRHLKIRNNVRQQKSISLGRAPIFTSQQENEILQHVQNMAKLFFGITKEELCRLVYKYAEANNIKHNFNRTKEMAGHDWYKNFLRRNNGISLRKPESTSVNRITAFNKTEVNQYFQNLSNVIDKNNFPPERMYNVDETGISIVPKETAKRLGPKGIKQFGVIASGERGKNVTVICAVSAVGSYIPPLFVFPRKRMTPLLEKNGPAGAVYCCTKNGWSNEDIFYRWLQHFQNHVRATKENPILLILDNHSSHISLEIYEYCKKNSIVMVSLPPHTSHKLQPLDVTFFGPLKSAFSRHAQLLMRSKINSASDQYKLSQYDLAEIFNSAYKQVANIEKGVSGFEATGIIPFNNEKFCEDDFAASRNFEENVNIVNNLVEEEEPNTLPPTAEVEPVSTRNVLLAPTDSNRSPQPSTSKNDYQISLRPNVKAHVSISTISPVPTASANKKKKKTTKQHSEILTSTPMKKILEDKQEKKKEKLIKKNQTSKTKKTIQSKKQSEEMRVKKRVFDSDSSEANEIDESQICDDDEMDDLPGSSEQDICVICDEFGIGNEPWYRCTMCGKWAHKECSGVETAKDYRCDFCRY